MSQEDLEKILAAKSWGEACTVATSLGRHWLDVVDEIEALRKRPYGEAPDALVRYGEGPSD